MLARIRYPRPRRKLSLMPNNAGVVDATPTRKILHFQYIDSEGKLRTDSYDLPLDATDAEINALAAAVGATSNASLWNVGYTNWFNTAVASKSDADNNTNDSVMDNVVILMKNTANLSFDFFIPANLESATMVTDTENPDPTLVEMIAVTDALVAIWGGYSPVSMRMSERRKINKAVKL